MVFCPRCHGSNTYIDVETEKHGKHKICLECGCRFRYESGETIILE